MFDTEPPPASRWMGTPQSEGSAAPLNVCELHVDTMTYAWIVPPCPDV